MTPRPHSAGQVGERMRPLDGEDQAKTSRLWSTLDRIRVTLGLGAGDFAELLQLTEGEYLKRRREQRDISIVSAGALAERLHIGLESLVTGRLDYRVLGSNFRGGCEHLPSRYTQGALSRMRTANAFLDYAENRYGWEMRASVLRQFQVSEAALMNQDGLVNLRLASDLCEYIHRYTQSLDPIYEMGVHSGRVYSSTVIGDLIRKEKDVLSAHEFVVSEILSRYIESNFVWKITAIDGNRLLLAGRPNPDLPKDRAIVHPLICVLRGGFMSSVATIFGAPQSRVRKTGCILDGDCDCRYELDIVPKAERGANVVPLRRKPSAGEAKLLF